MSAFLRIPKLAVDQQIRISSTEQPATAEDPFIPHTGVWFESALIPSVPDSKLQHDGDSVGVVAYYVKRELKASSTSGIYVLVLTPDKLLTAFNKAMMAGTYAPTVYDGKNAVVSPSGTYPWLLDSRNGVVSFPSGIPPASTLPFRMTFYQYIGATIPVASSVGLIPAAPSTLDIGTAAFPWRAIYTDTIAQKTVASATTPPAGYATTYVSTTDGAPHVVSSAGVDTAFALRTSIGPIHTGVIAAPTITAAGATTFNIGAGSGIVFEAKAPYQYASANHVWGDINGITSTLAAFEPFVWIGIDTSAGSPIGPANVVQQGYDFVGEQTCTIIKIGVITHLPLGSISGAYQRPKYFTTTCDFASSISVRGIIGSRQVITASAVAGLKINVGSGSCEDVGAGPSAFPNYVDTGAVLNAPMYRVRSSAIHGKPIIEAAQTDIDNLRYDDGKGSLVVLTDDASSKYILFYPTTGGSGVFFHVYGQGRSNTIAVAREHIWTDLFVYPQLRHCRVLAAVIIRSTVPQADLAAAVAAGRAEIYYPMR